MTRHIFGAVGLSVLLLFGATPAVLLAHEGYEHGEGGGGYRGEREDSGRYDPRYDDDRWEDEEEEEDDAYRSSTRRSPPPDWERSAPRERRSGPQ
jgi:hypothetical protein